jgi:hypothetical protein
MTIRILNGDIHLLPLQTRMPFRYGIAVMTRVPHAFLRLQVEIDGKPHIGLAADFLPPKWFTKDPRRDLAAEIHEMLAVIQHAVRIATRLSGSTPFDIWEKLWHSQHQWAAVHQLPPLLANFGPSLVERALIEAFCRATDTPFHQALRSNSLGIRLGSLHPQLHNLQPPDLLPTQPLRQLFVRHTIGLSDPLTREDIPPAERLDDGLPQSLDDCIRAYGLLHFKIKVNGDPEADLDRLQRVSRVIQARAGAQFAFSLDGNEQYQSLESFRRFWNHVTAEPSLRDFMDHLLFVEQPLHRNLALDESVGVAFRAWPGRPPIIIDESDASIESLPAALALGYSGTSHKNCKGIFKGIANRCLLRHLSSAPGERPLLMSGEDLTNVGPIALSQDLAVMSALGIESVERNGHHYYAGLSQFPADIQDDVLRTHPDLYRRSRDGWPTLDIQAGRLKLDSVNRFPLGAGVSLDVTRFDPAPEASQL